LFYNNNSFPEIWSMPWFDFTWFEKLYVCQDTHQKVLKPEMCSAPLFARYLKDQSVDVWERN
jgi:hypothetical protein